MNELANEIAKLNPDQMIEMAIIIAQKAKQPTPKPKQKPTIFERFPVGSHICGFEVLEHDAQDDIPFKLGNGKQDLWIEDTFAYAFIVLHDWILKYHPVIEAAREWSISSNNYKSSDFISTGYVNFSQNLEKNGLWKNREPVKLPWE